MIGEKPKKEEKMEINREELLKILKECSAAVHRGGSLQSGIDCFFFDGGSVHSYGMDLSISRKLPFDAGVFVIDADILLKFISKLKGTDIGFDFDSEKNVLIVSSSGMKSKIKCLEIPEDKDYFICGLIKNVLQNILSSDKKELPANFLDCVGFCEIRNNLTPHAGLYVDGCGVYSCSRTQISFSKLLQPMDSFFIDERIFKSIKGGPEFTHYSLSEEWLHLLNEDASYSFRRILEVNFPLVSIKKYVENNIEKDGFCCVLPKETGDVLNQASIFCSKNAKKILIGLKKDEIRFFVNGNYGTFDKSLIFEEEADVPEDFEPFDIMVNPDYFQNVDLSLPLFFIVKKENDKHLVCFTDLSNRLHIFMSLVFVNEEETC